VDRVKTLDFDETSSLDAMWRAYLSVISQGSENALGTPWQPTCLGPATFLSVAVVFMDCGAGVGQRIYIGQYSDTSGLDYFNARYFSPNQGQFISQDPIFLGNPLQQNLKDPQSLNGYAYSEDNPITRSDPSGLFDAKNGVVQKGDTLGMITQAINGINGTNYSVNQVAKLNGISNPNKISVGQQIVPNMTFLTDISNPLIKTVQSNVNNTPSIHSGLLGMANFLYLVRPGGAWDLKSQPGQYNSQTHSAFVFNGKIVRNDFPGNFNYGYTGISTTWASADLLLSAAGAVQTSSNANTNIKPGALQWSPNMSTAPYFDNPGDSEEIQAGITANK
jgi:RHS repeat-associated protein